MIIVNSMGCYLSYGTIYYLSGREYHGFQNTGRVDGKFHISDLRLKDLYDLESFITIVLR